MNTSFIISQADGRPMYLQIMEQVRERIAVGEWAPGDRIPSIRELAVAAKVSVITVKRAYLELEREGVIATVQGKGSFVSEEPSVGEELRERELEDHLGRALRLAPLVGVDLEDLVDLLREMAEHQEGETQ